MRYQGPAYRGHNPKWAFSPVSGDGAAVHGGRFNPKGVPALYLATSPEGAFVEATRGFAYKFKPLTLCSYDVDCADIVDLSTNDSRRQVGVDLKDMACAWLSELSEGRRPASWALHDTLHKAAAGLLTPSFARGARDGMTNLVLWDWSEHAPHKVRVHDPDHGLPRNQNSWT